MEFLEFSGVSFYARGLLHRNLIDIENLFNEKVGYQIYSSVMSLNRFKFIKKMITFDDSTARNYRWKKDKFSSFRGMLDMFNKQCARNYSLDDFLAIDEALYLTPGSFGLKTYNKDNPDKYGLNFRSLVSARKA